MLSKLYPSQHRRSAAGITMVEVAIVFLIIGGLLAAFLSYKEVVRITKLRKVATEAQSFGIAARTFEQKYDALPGDFNDASGQLKDCLVNADGTPNNTNFCRNGNGNGRIGRYCHFMWPECGQTGRAIPPSDPNGNPVATTPDTLAEAQEVTQFWKHLYLAGLITGIIDPRYDPNSDYFNPNTSPRWRVSNPESSVWEAGYTVSGQGAFIGGSVDVNFVPTPEYPATSPNDRSLTGNDAIYMDRKYDDGNAGAGALWWGPEGTNNAGCRHGNEFWDAQARKNCTFTWTVF